MRPTYARRHWKFRGGSRLSGHGAPPCSRRALAPDVGTAISPARRQVAVQPPAGPPRPLQRLDRRAGHDARAGVRAPRAPRPPPDPQPPRFHPRRGPDERRRAGERTGDAVGAARRRPRHRAGVVDHVPQEGARPAGGRVSLHDPRGAWEPGIRGRGDDSGWRGRRRGPCRRTLAVGTGQTAVTLLDTPLTRTLGIEVPLICGAMFPCSNPELVAAVSEAGGIGVVQPLSLTYVHGYDFQEGLAVIRRLTSKPIGMNVLIEQSSRAYMDRMRRFVDLALQSGVRFFVTSLGNPRWVVER